MTTAYITTKNGILTAECNGIDLDLEDCGLSRSFGFGESVEIEYEPTDRWELMDQLAALA